MTVKNTDWIFALVAAVLLFPIFPFAMNLALHLTFSEPLVFGEPPVVYWYSLCTARVFGTILASIGGFLGVAVVGIPLGLLLKRRPWLWGTVCAVPSGLCFYSLDPKLFVEFEPAWLLLVLIGSSVFCTTLGKSLQIRFCRHKEPMIESLSFKIFPPSLSVVLTTLLVCIVVVAVIWITWPMRVPVPSPQAHYREQKRRAAFYRELRRLGCEGKPDTGKVCQLHHEMLRVDSVIIYYGLTRLDPSWEQTAKTLFPNSRTHILGGCIPESRHLFECVLYCPRCREAEKLWKAENDPMSVINTMVPNALPIGQEDSAELFFNWEFEEFDGIGAMNCPE